MAPWDKPGRCSLCGHPFDDHKLERTPPLCPPPWQPKPKAT